MSDWREAAEVQEQDVSPEARDQAPGLEGISSIRGDVGSEESAPVDAPGHADDSDGSDDIGQADDSQNLVTVRPKKSPEHLPNVEAEGKVIDLDEGWQEGKPKPPPGVHPGGPERGW